MPATRLGWEPPAPIAPAAPPESAPRFNRRVVVTSAEDAARISADWSREYAEAHPEESGTEPTQDHEGDETP
jgi:hypothetical protein